MDLPVPSPEEVAEFRALYLLHRGVVLSDADALDQCSRLVKYLYLTRVALPRLRENAEG